MSEQSHFRFAKKKKKKKKAVVKVARVVGNMHNANLTACKLFRKARRCRVSILDPRSFEFKSTSRKIVTSFVDSC